MRTTSPRVAMWWNRPCLLLLLQMQWLFQPHVLQGLLQSWNRRVTTSTRVMRRRRSLLPMTRSHRCHPWPEPQKLILAVCMLVWMLAAPHRDPHPTASCSARIRTQLQSLPLQSLVANSWRACRLVQLMPAPHLSMFMLNWTKWWQKPSVPRLGRKLNLRQRSTQWQRVLSRFEIYAVLGSRTFRNCQQRSPNLQLTTLHLTIVKAKGQRPRGKGDSAVA
mmetsp:Transcript_130303/g.259914  ORF Transcript_130303/g.259914 Transcript_130303/m.259914 type:complete len:220 (+) Transcript_130303:87-746(+)